MPPFDSEIAQRRPVVIRPGEYELDGYRILCPRLLLCGKKQGHKADGECYESDVHCSIRIASSGPKASLDLWILGGGCRLSPPPAKMFR
jgi:hypothetical protein